MKTIHHKMIIPAGLGLLAILPAPAIEPPKDDAPPPPSVKAPDSAPKSGDGLEVNTRPLVPTAKEATAFIGIISDDIPEMLSAHIGLRAGEGVMIRDLAPGGPAEKAGFAKYDVITHVGGKTVGSPVDLSREISAGKPGDDVSIDFIHQGTKATKTVKLETRPEGASTVVDPRQLGHLDLDSMPDGQADRIRDMIDRQLMRDSGQLREFRERRGDAFQRESDPGSTPRKNGFRGFQFKSDATFRFMDNDGSIEMKSSDGKKDITVRDHEGREIWAGPWDTDQDKSAAPKDVRERIEKFKFDDNFRGGGFRFRMGGGDREDPRDIR
ncbi:PDZ domain-containing protein [Luteolibacter sp. SL250]|uniref:S1C family serine protease n=1 Tax=Luteolibacter sp. SL250 TaxID=2995170 RepID=UPI002270A939|nr:PDZ domain-containing protein [Luteolibacter sp. SL250]WAC18299.1 PDZ domain-containing protein [Luteolibacter sp. SL250]